MTEETFNDKVIVCGDCNKEFVFSAGEQARHKELGFVNEPKRCPPCRAERKKNNVGRDRGPQDKGQGPKEFFPIKCSECGVDTEVPFKPRGDRPVYCLSCFRKR
jgi:CxxC-x17-CxxC domain-containing protein